MGSREVAVHLAVFVYGTLMRGHENHRLCRGALHIEPAFTRGRLFRLPAGYPALAVRPETVLAHAHGALDVDLEVQLKWDRRLQAAAAVEARQESGEEPPVFGEWMVFEDPAQRLPLLDLLEGCRPGLPSLYRRVLVPTWVGEAPPPRAAWTYVQAHPRGSRLRSGRWRRRGADEP